jgi:hypothetical protein
VNVGTVDRVEGNRIKLKERDSSDGLHKAHHHYIELGFVAGVEGTRFRLTANAATAVTLEGEKIRKTGRSFRGSLSIRALVKVPTACSFPCL